jgi:hypothetical protein
VITASAFTAAAAAVAPTVAPAPAVVVAPVVVCLLLLVVAPAAAVVVPVVPAVVLLSLTCTALTSRLHPYSQVYTDICLISAHAKCYTLKSIANKQSACYSQFSHTW